MYENKIKESNKTRDPLVTGFDNYNDKFGNSRFSTKKDHPYDLVNYTVVGSLHAEHHVDMSWVYEKGIFVLLIICF